MADEKPQLTNDEKRMALTEHLGELRTRLMRSITYIIVGAILAYQIFPYIYGFLYKPLNVGIERWNKEHGKIVNAGIAVIKHADHDPVAKIEYDQLVDAHNKLIENPPSRASSGITFRDFFAPFMTHFSMSLIFGLILAIPWVTWEMFQFVVPALTKEERKPFRLLIPTSAVLLTMGVTLGYNTMFYAMHWFLSYMDEYPQPAILQQDPNTYVLFFMKLIAVFGIVFQLPIVLMSLSFLGLVTSKGIIKGWRWGIILSAVGAVCVPSNDYITMTLISSSILFLYFISFFFVRYVEYIKKRPKKPAEQK